MPIQDFFNSATALRLGLWLGRHMPYQAGHWLADMVTGVLARSRNSQLYQAVYNNMSVVLGPEATEEERQRAVRAVFKHAGHAYFDLYHVMGRGREALDDIIQLSPQTMSYLAEWQGTGQGVMAVTGHMGNLDLAGLALAANGVDPLILGVADPPSGYELQDDLRTQVGLQVLRVDVHSLRRALRHLRAGGVVLTGIDRPDPYGSGEDLCFFGRRARLPVGHIRLAVQTGTPIVVTICEYRPSDGTYVVHVVKWLDIEPMGSREETLRHNAERALQVMERLIRAHPEQWLMFFPVWE